MVRANHRKSRVPRLGAPSIGAVAIALAGLTKECQVWTKKQPKLRGKCNALLLKKGPTYADKGKDVGPEPVGCDPGDFVEAALELAHADNDQQIDPMNAESIVEQDLLLEQMKCQKRFDKAAVGFVNKYVNLVNKKCVLAGVDDASCRFTQVNDSKKKLDQIDKCVGDQLVDGGAGVGRRGRFAQVGGWENNQRRERPRRVGALRA